MKIKNFVWDFDGTLADTYPHTATAFVNTMAEYGIKADYDKDIAIMRQSLSSIKSVYDITDEQYNHFVDNAHDLWFDPKPTLYEGVEKVLERIVLAGGKNFMYTNRNDTSIKYLEHFGILKFFTECIYCTCSSYASKPSGEPIEYLINKYSLDKDCTAMVGDRELDILCGKKAGCKGILFDEFKIYKETDADAIVYSIKEIESFIK